jgi:tetratricopeptide (TPR) repeat protein
VFAGGWTEDAAREVVPPEIADVAAALDTLVEHSLVSSELVAGRARFSMLEPVRQYAEGRLVDAGLLGTGGARRAAWVAGWLAGADTGLRGPDELRWSRAVEAELANVRAAHRWAFEHDPALALTIVARLSWYAYFRGSSEMFGWADETVERFAGPPLGDEAAVQSRAHATAAIGAWRRGELDRAKAIARRGVDLASADDPTVARFAWDSLRSAEALSGRYEPAIAARDRAMSLARQAGDTVFEAHSRIAGALALGYLGAFDAATDELAEAASLLDMIDNPTTRAFADYVAGEIRIDPAPAEAIALLRRSRDTALAVGNRFIAGIAGASAVSCAARHGDAAAAIDEYPDLIEHFHRVGVWAQLWTMIRALIETLTRVGRHEPAAVLYGALSATDAASPIIGPDAGRLADTVSELRTRLGDDAFERLTAEGAVLGDEGAAAYAIAECSPGPTAR